MRPMLHPSRTDRHRPDGHLRRPFGVGRGASRERPPGAATVAAVRGRAADVGLGALALGVAALVALALRSGDAVPTSQADQLLTRPAPSPVSTELSHREPEKLAFTEESSPEPAAEAASSPAAEPAPAPAPAAQPAPVTTSAPASPPSTSPTPSPSPSPEPSPTEPPEPTPAPTLSPVPGTPVAVPSEE
jgi:outer membrane biosynthesis protein TonB